MDVGCRAAIGTLALIAALAATLSPPRVGAGSLDRHLEALSVQALSEPLPAPAAKLEHLAGGPWSLDELRGRVVFLNFWATWCVPCRKEMPAMERLHRRYRDRGFVVIAVNFQESADAVRRYVDELHLTFPVALDGDGDAARRFRVRVLPVTFLLDGQGRILWRSIGPRAWDGPDGLAYLDALLGPPPGG